MFLKLFKYDFKGLGRWMWPVMIGIGGAAVLGFLNTLFLGGTSRLDTSSAGASVMLMSAVGGTALVAMALAAAVTVIFVLIFVKFYKSMVTDEAYLTFTLPVTAGQLIGSKFLAAAVWTLIGGVVIACASCVIAAGLLISGGPELREDFFWILGDVADTLLENLGTVLLFFLFSLIRSIRGYFQITCAILFGASVVRKYKALAAVGMVLAVNFAVNLILSVFGAAGLFPLVFGMDYGFGAGGSLSLESVLWIQIAVDAVLVAVFWWWSWHIAKKSVNIE
ncbi:MAG: hypothetical protein E7576_04920 [Ruminococcaceae bacterium]|jgi:hypothetical protein|nr:hypothetical protein [Oscillospiraceae bacterium]